MHKLTIRLDPHTHAKSKRIAEEKGLSLSEFIRRLILKTK